MSDTKVLPQKRGRPLDLRLVVTSGPDAGGVLRLDRRVTIGTSPNCDLVMTDPSVSRQHCTIEPRARLALVHDDNSMNGTWLDGTLIHEVQIAPGVELVIGESRIRIDVDRFRAPADPRPENRDRFGRFLGGAPALQRLYTLAQAAAENAAPVLIEGESGTGKELLAESIHEEGPRRDKNFVVVDCVATPESMFEVELFGEAARAGALEMADGGTLFLDGVGELSLTSQSRLLGALDRQRFRRLGDSELREVDVRVITSTSRSLEHEVERDRFRLDLLHRIAVCVLRIPPLRERPEDIPTLARHFDPSSRMSTDIAERLSAHAWPGNVRELRNHIERVVIDGADPLRPDAGVHPILAAARTDVPFRQARAALLEAFTQLYVSEQLARTDGNVTQAARASGMARRHFHRLKRDASSS